MAVEFANPNHEWWPRPSDGCLVPLVLQSGQEPWSLPETSRWSRLGTPSSRVSPLLRASYWVGSSLFVPRTRSYDLRIGPIAITAAKLVIAWPVFCVLVCWTGNLTTALIQLNTIPGFSDHSRYDTVRIPRPTTTHGDSCSHPYQPASQEERASVTASAPSDSVGALSSEQPYTDNIRLNEALLPSRLRHTATSTSPISLRPRYLCFVKDFEEGSYETVKVSDYLEQHGDDTDLEFVFVSYTRMQFRVATDEEINRHQYPDEANREANRVVARQDRQTLARWGIDAARRVGKRAFWLDFECVRNDDGVARSTSSSEDVYRICDIVRAAHSMIIAIGPSAADKVSALLKGRETPEYRREEVTPWLRQWGSRLWTLPELLLCPAEYRINLYVLGDPAEEPKAMAKRNFAERAWDDAEAVKELVDHFEGSAILTELRLIEAALSCFSRRQTDQFSQGDIAYATMGLFPNRHRPRVDKEDSGFQAFAKLSLANDSGAFLSRLVCLAPPQQDAPWHQTGDRWGVKLSDIYPSCNVSGVAGREAVMLDGVHGATIHWDRVDPEPLFGQNAKFVFAWLLLVQMVCLSAPMALLAMTYIVSLLSVAKLKAFLVIYFWTLPAVGLVALASPMVLIGSRRRLSQPKKSRLLGVEGIVDAGRISRYLWGFDHGDLTTVTPPSYSDVDDGVQTATPPPPSSHRLGAHGFTLVDTSLLTVTHFYCSQPPVAMFVCGSEGGRQRTLLCSYDWRTQTYHRQSVLRVPRRGLDQFHLVDGVRLSLAPHPDVDANSPSNTSNSEPSSLSGENLRDSQPGGDMQQSPCSRATCRTWKTEILFMAICFAGLTILGDPVHGHGHGITASYIYFIAGLLFAVASLRYLPLNQATMYTFAASVIMAIINDALTEGNVAKHVVFAYAFVKGCLALTLIKLMLSWYPTDELPMRFLLWNVSRTSLLDTLGFLGVVYYIRACIFVLGMVVFYALLTTEFMDRVGGPEDVSWLDPHQRLYYSSRAAATGFPRGVSTRIMWRDRRQQLIRLARPLLVFAVSLASSLSLGASYGNQSEPGAALVAILVGLVVYKFPSKCLITMVVCSILSGVSTLLGAIHPESHALFPLPLLQRLNGVVPPLLWATVVLQASIWTEALDTVTISWIGVAVGHAILIYTSDKIPTLVVQLPLFLGQITIWGMIWACGWVTGRIILPEDVVDGQITSERNDGEHATEE